MLTGCGLAPCPARELGQATAVYGIFFMVKNLELGIRKEGIVSENNLTEDTIGFKILDT
jgi:hypothetical protein